MKRSALFRAAAWMALAGFSLIGGLTASTGYAAPADCAVLVDSVAPYAASTVTQGLQPSPLRFLLRLPSAGGTAVLTGSDGTKQVFATESDTVVLSALPDSYILTCGERSASLTVTATGVSVRSGPASWDGERLTFGDYATLELHCTVPRDTQRSLTVQTASETQTLPAGYDPLLDSGTGCEIVHILTLPAGTVTVSDATASRSVELSPGETLRLVF